tara:strand:- start:6461 stop:6826 length:366 start_codon:yes stop_codon:yes gene_type:complete
MCQNFKKKYNIYKFINIILKYGFKQKKNEYVFSQISYKQMIFNNELTPLITELSKCYHKSKQFYLKRDITYKNLLTILRQIMNSLKLTYTSNLIYNKSKHNINYTIYINDEILKEIEKSIA